MGEHTVKYTLKEPTFIGIDGDLSDPSSVKVGAIFASCYSVESVEIPNSVTRIGTSAFYDCWRLTSVTIPDSVTSIGGWAFSSCIGLSSVTIGSGIITISEGAFNGCESLTSVTVEAATPPILNDYVFDGVSGNMIIYVPANSVDAYKSAW